MMKKNGHLALITILAFLLAMTCATTASPVLAAEYSKELRLASPMPPQSFAGQMHQWWAKELEKRTNGRVKVKFFWMESLVKWKDMLQGVASGIADVGLVAPTYHPSDLPLYMLLDNPLNAVDYWAGVRACTDTCTKQPDLVAELKRNHIKHVAPWCSGKFNFCTKKKWNALSDLKGKTFRSYGGAQIDFLENLGINPIFMPYSEIYEALQRGTIDGNGTCVLQLSDALKHYETIEQCTDMKAGFVVAGSSLALNYEVWEGMPKDIQNIIDQLNYDMGDYWAKSLYEDEAKIEEKWKTKYGILFNEISGQNKVISDGAAEKADETFIGKMEAQKLPAKKVWSYFRNQVVKYEAEVKAKGRPWERK
jgi:TRAP-type C4-dicarboxylate transport system substrate-binding protein